MRRIEIILICFRCVEKQHFDRRNEHIQSIIVCHAVNICDTPVNVSATASETGILIGVQNSFGVMQLVRCFIMHICNNMSNAINKYIYIYKYIYLYISFSTL